jgi:class 3 adenylate cyclase
MPVRVISEPIRSRGLPGAGVWGDRVHAGRAAAWSAFYAVGVETFTFLFTDIEGSTALLGRVGDGAYAQVLAGHHGLIRSALAAYDGIEVDTQGDAFFAVFSSPRRCVAAVLEMQQALQGRGHRGCGQLRLLL